MRIYFVLIFNKTEFLSHNSIDIEWETAFFAFISVFCLANECARIYLLIFKNVRSSRFSISDGMDDVGLDVGTQMSQH